MASALRTRKGLGLTLLVLVAVAGFVALGRWQYERARPEVLEPVSGAPVALVDVVSPASALRPDVVGRTVTVSGVFEPRWQLFVVDRAAAPTGTQAQAASGGYWVLTPLRTASGALLPVVRGWTQDRGSVSPAPSGTVKVRGTIVPSEAPATASSSRSGPLLDDELVTISTAELIGLYPTRTVYDGFVVQDPPTPGLEPVDAGLSRTGSWHLLNAGYALQWWVFAGCAVFFWARWIRDTAGATASPRPGETDPRGSDRAEPEETPCPPDR
ncbi:MAG: SURF1 family protein [Actinomycetes bacterium]